MVNDNDMQQALATTLLNQLEDMDADNTGHHRRQMAHSYKSYLKLSIPSIIFVIYPSISKFTELTIPTLLVFQNYISSHIVNVECVCMCILCNIVLSIDLELIKYGLIIMIILLCIMN